MIKISFYFRQKIKESCAFFFFFFLSAKGMDHRKLPAHTRKKRAKDQIPGEG